VAHAFVVPTVASSVDIVVHAMADARGARRVREISGVTGHAEGHTIGLEPLFRWSREGLVRGTGFPPHAERFDEQGIDLARLLGVGV